MSYNVFCKEQFVQTALIECLKKYDDAAVAKLQAYAKLVAQKAAQEKQSLPRFFNEFERALDLTQAIREEIQAMDAGYRVEPKEAIISAELLLEEPEAGI